MTDLRTFDFHSGTLAFRAERQSARMSEIKNHGRLGLYGAEHSKYNHMMTLGFKGINVLRLGTERSRRTSVR